MRKPWPFAGLAALVATIFVIASATQLAHPASAGTTNCQTSSAELDAAEQEMLRLHNQARAAHGLEPLTLSPTLSRAAAWKSADSSAVPPGFSHTDSLGRSPARRAQDCGYPTGAGENIAYGFPGVRATFDAWMNSDGHRANILSPYYRAIGIGAEGSAWTVKFGTIVDSQSEPAPTPTPTPTPAAIPPTPTPTTAPPAPSATVEPQPDEGVVLTLYRGINLVTYIQPTARVRQALAGIEDNVQFVYQYDAATGQWLRYLPGAPSYINTLRVLTYGQAYYIGTNAETDWGRR